MAQFFHYKVHIQTMNEALRNTVWNVLNLWKKCLIPTQLKKHVVAIIKRIFFHEWENKVKRSKNLKNKVDQCARNLYTLFETEFLSKQSEEKTRLEGRAV